MMKLNVPILNYDNIYSDKYNNETEIDMEEFMKIVCEHKSDADSDYDIAFVNVDNHKLNNVEIVK